MPFSENGESSPEARRTLKQQGFIARSELSAADPEHHGAYRQNDNE
ncbi:hypothetical protein [Pseudomonas syringae]|nr:hypothetical protein [Pseudomonas syringae]